MTILAPLRGVTTRLFRETFAEEIAEAGFDEAVTPFISAMHGVDPLADDELFSGSRSGGLKITPQFIGKDPAALRECLKRIKDAGWEFADLNCGCPFPMIRKKGRGSGILKTPGVLAQMLEAGCDVMGPGKFSAKTRLGLDAADELLSVAEVFNAFPLRRVTIHARTARQMYSGECDSAAFAAVAAEARMPVVRNGDVPLSAIRDGREHIMIGRAFLRNLGARRDSRKLLGRYAAALRKKLCGPRPVLGAVKELASYWKAAEPWSRLWNVLKMCRTLDELDSVLAMSL